MFVILNCRYKHVAFTFISFFGNVDVATIYEAYRMCLINDSLTEKLHSISSDCLKEGDLTKLLTLL